MVAGCGNNCIKYILFVINFLFFVMGAVAIGLGIWALVDKNNMSDLTSLDKSGEINKFNGVGLLQSGAIALIVGGSFLLITGFAGCCGAVKEVKCLLGVYIAIVLVVLIAEVVAAGLAIAFRSKIEDELQTALIKGVENKYEGILNASSPFSRAFDLAQIEFECCGVNSTRDFDNSPWAKAKGNDKVPKTCCKLNDKNSVLKKNTIDMGDMVNPNCSTTDAGPGNPNTNTPCYQAIRDWVMKHAGIIIGIGFGIVGIEIFAIIFACCLYRAIED